MGFFSEMSDSIALSFERGGPVMYVILVFSVYAVAVCAERWLHYRKHHKLLKTEWYPLLEALKELRSANKLYEADATTPAQRIVRIAVNNAEIAKEELSDKLRAGFLFETEKMEKGLSMISVITTLLPMLGLLGTVTGMVIAFDAIAQYGTGDPKLVAEGISQALLTTVAGLISSIPLTVLHSNLASKSDNLIRRIDEFVSAVLHLSLGKR